MSQPTALRLWPIYGVEALAYLKCEPDRHMSCPRPDLILLALNMPRLGGREVLAYLKTDDHFQNDPRRHPDHIGVGGGR